MGTSSVYAAPEVYTEKTTSVSYNWGLEGPNGLRDNFQATFDQSQHLSAGDYFIQTLADDGVTVNFDGMKVIDRPKYSWTTLIDREVVQDVKEGNHSIITDYYEGTGSAVVYSDIVKFGDWLAYYYDNQEFDGTPVASKVIQADSNGDLIETNWQNSPVPGIVPKDYFSATYVTAKKIPAGDYVLNLGADDGAQVYIDGKLVLDRYKPTGYREDAVKVNVKDGANGDIHWIEVKYKEGILSSRVKLSMRPFSEIVKTDGWVGEIFPSSNFSGNPIIIGGDLFGTSINTLDLNWKAGSPSPLIPKDNFTARFHRNINLSETGVYKMKVWADDKVRVYVDGDLVIDSWKYIPGSYREETLPITKGNHHIEIEYAEAILNSRIKFDLQKQHNIEETKKSVAYNWGQGGPNGLKDHFTAKFDQSQKLTSGDYFIQTRADDGIFMEVNGEVKINRWKYSSDTIDKALLTDVAEGNYEINTLYREGTKAANVYSNVVKFGDWLAYYFNNENFAGAPAASKVITGNDENGFAELNWQESPVPGKVSKDHFTASYVTAKRIPAGDYVINLGADDGAQVYIDGKLVLDRLTPVGYREDAVKVSIKDTQGSDVHWIEVKYKEGILSSRVKFSMKPYTAFENSVLQDGWIGEIYPSKNFTGTPTILGGFGDVIDKLDFNWGQSSPSPMIPKDNFSTRFKKKMSIGQSGYYVINAWADDGVRVYIDGEEYINSWKYNSNHLRQNRVYLEKGEHEVIVEHYDGTLSSRLTFDLVKAKDTYTATEKSVGYNWRYDSPNVEVQPDNFTAVFDQSQYLKSGDYFVQTFADDGVTFEFNGQKVIDRPKYSWSSILDRALLTNVKAGNQRIKTTYYEGTGQAILFSDIVMFNDWLAYYYPNRELDGPPIASKVIVGEGKYGKLVENNGQGSPVPGVVPKDSFSAKYVTAKRIKAGEYVLRTGADDGVQVYIDGELILDRFTNGGFREDSIKINIEDNPNAKTGQKDIHWIEVRYKEASQGSRITAYLQPYSEAMNLAVSDGWVGEFYSNKDLSGPSVLMGGHDPVLSVHDIDFYWKNEPSPFIPEDNFSAKFMRKINVSEKGAGYYNFVVSADDGVRLKVIDEKGNETSVIDSWRYVSGKVRQNKMKLDKGQYTIVIEYYDGILAGSLDFKLKKMPEVISYVNYNYTFNYLVETQIAKGSPKADGQGRITASREQIEYYTNPLNFLKDTPAYMQFLKLSEPAGLDAKEVNEKILAGKGSLAGTAQAFIDAGKKYRINEAYLIAHTLHETGNGKSTLAAGVPVDSKGKVVRDSKGNIVTNPNDKRIYKFVYNMYGYGAYDGCAIDCGAKYAFDRNWFTPSAAIIGGAANVSTNYIQAGQDTLFKMKWNPANPGTHQYATHVAWAYLQTNRISQIYGLINNYTLVFEVPVFKNQPSSSGNPNILKLIEINVGKSSLNIRSNHNTSATVLGSVRTGDILTAVLDNKNNLVRYNEWYKVYYNGKEAWVSGGKGGTEYIKVK